MGTAQSTNVARCEPKEVDPLGRNLDAPPTMIRQRSFDEKLYDKFTKQPLVPIGCAATAYFLVSGIRSFKNREPRRAQKMMRARVGAQFATLLVFIGYMGLDSFNFEVAPRYQRYKEHQAKLAADNNGSAEPESK